MKQGFIIFFSISIALNTIFINGNPHPQEDPIVIQTTPQTEDIERSKQTSTISKWASTSIFAYSTQLDYYCTLQK